MKRIRLFATGLLAAFAALPLAARAEAAPEAHAHAAPDGAQHDEERADPWQRFNRGAYAFGQVLDHFAFRPLAMCYKHWLPRPLRAGVGHVLSNLDEPEIGLNDLLQGKPRAAGTTVLRFAVNSTLGLIGVFDVARHAGFIHHDNDAGLTLAHFGIAQGPYLYVPLAGPSSVRDLTGAGADFLLDPLGWISFRHADLAFDTQILADALSERADADADLRDVDATAADPYATLRSYYLQEREALTHGGGAVLDELAPIPDVGDAAAPLPADAAAASARAGEASVSQ